MDPIFFWAAHNDKIATQFGSIAIDATQAHERWLSYAYFNIMKFYRNSPLGQYMSQNVRLGSTFVDVGANLGVYSLLAKSFGYTSYLVEPEPKHAAFLSRNADVYGKSFNVALSDHPGSLPLFYEASNSGATSLVPASGYKQGEDVIAVRTFSSLAGEGAFSDPKDISLIKIDVEGAESQTVSGMAEFLETGCRPAIWCEVRGDLSGRAPGTYRSVMSALAGYGYKASEFVKGRRREPIPSALPNRGVFDLLFEK